MDITEDIQSGHASPIELAEHDSEAPLGENEQQGATVRSTVAEVSKAGRRGKASTVRRGISTVGAFSMSGISLSFQGTCNFEEEEDSRRE